jgi:uncharacterized membrane protein YgcG
LFHLSIIFLRAYDAMHSLDHGVEMGRTAAAQLAALCAAHWEAVQALAAAAAPSGGLVLAAENNFMVLLRAYHRIASTCPFLATPTFFHPLLGAVQQACNGSSVRAPMQGIVEALLPAADHPQVAAAAAFSGLLLLAADSAHAAATQDQAEAGAAIVGEWMNQIERVLLCLETGAAAACRNLTGGSTTDSGTSNRGSDSSQVSSASSSDGSSSGAGGSDSGSSICQPGHASEAGEWDEMRILLDRPPCMRCCATTHTSHKQLVSGRSSSLPP